MAATGEVSQQQAELPHQQAEVPKQQDDVRNGYMQSVTEEYQAKRCHWFRILRTFDLQFASFDNSVFLCISSCMININYLFNRKITEIETIVASLWYVGVVFGCILCGCNRYTWSSRTPNLILAILLILSGIMSCLEDLFGSRTNILIAPARFISGSCFGFAYVKTLAHIGDNAWKARRGHAGNNLLLPPLFAFICVFHSDWGNGIQASWSRSKRHSVETVVYMGSIVFTVNLIYTIRTCKFEPITRFLKSNDVESARRLFTEENCGVLHSSAIEKEIEDKVKMMSEDYNGTQERWFWGIFTKGNWKPLFLMLLLRVLSIWTSNLYLLTITIQHIDVAYLYNLRLPIITCLCLLAILPARYSIDKFGRKYFLLISGIGSGISSIPLVLLYYRYMGLYGLVKYGCIMLHVFASFGIEPVSHIYAIEAFPLSMRNASIGFISSFEFIVQGLIVVLMIENYYSMTLRVMVMVMPFIVIPLTMLLFIMLPETKGKTIRECRATFNHFYQLHTE